MAIDPASTVDQLVAVMRQRLTARAVKGKVQSASQGLKRDRIELAAVAQNEDWRQLRRAFVQQLLGERLGQGLINDARFQSVINRVLEALDAEPELSDELDALVQAYARGL